MPAPLSYTEDQLAVYMRDGVLRGVAADLGWTDVSAGGVYTEIVNNVLLDYGVAAIADAIDVKQLRCLARINVWKSVVEETVRAHSWTGEGMTYNAEQVHAQAITALKLARADCGKYEQVTELEDLNWTGSCGDEEA